MGDSKLLAFCKYYKGESENPFKYSLDDYSLLSELKNHFWEYERMFVEHYNENATETTFKTYINGCINKCTPSEYDPYTAYFDGVLRNKSEV